MAYKSIAEAVQRAGRAVDILIAEVGGWHCVSIIKQGSKIFFTELTLV